MLIQRLYNAFYHLYIAAACLLVCLVWITSEVCSRDRLLGTDSLKFFFFYFAFCARFACLLALGKDVVEGVPPDWIVHIKWDGDLQALVWFSFELFCQV